MLIYEVVDECMHKDNTSDRLSKDSIPRSFKAEPADLVAAGHAKEVVTSGTRVARRFEAKDI